MDLSRIEMYILRALFPCRKRKINAMAANGKILFDESVEWTSDGFQWGVEHFIHASKRSTSKDIYIDKLSYEKASAEM